MRRLLKILRWPLCATDMCPFRTYSTPDGIGGKCIHCGKITGWVTREELRAYADRELRDLRGKP